MIKNNLADSKVMQVSREIAKSIPAIGNTAAQMGGDVQAAGAAIKENETPTGIPEQQEYGDDLATFTKTLSSNPRMRTMLEGIIGATGSTGR